MDGLDEREGSGAPGVFASMSSGEAQADGIAETARLAIRRFGREDAPFIVELLNDPDWVRYIGDKGVRTIDDARRYLENGPLAMYARHGFGLYLVAEKRSGTPIGMCGLIKREALDDVDLGFAFLPAYRGQGHALEASAAVMRHGREAFGLRRMVAIVSPDNVPSARLLGKLGFLLEGTITLQDEALDLYAAAA